MLPSLEGGRSAGKHHPKSAMPTKRRVIAANNGEASGGEQQPNYLQTTFQQTQRAANIGVSSSANNISFEARVKELHSAKDSTLRLNAKVIETWINETLKDAEHLDIPGVVLKPEHKNPVSRYQIDRLSLTNAGVPNEQVDRIYRGLFVYSIGFYEMLQRALHHAGSKYILLSSLWRVFAILLEYCCKSNYQMLISKLNEEHRGIIEGLERDFAEHLQKASDSEKHLKDALDGLQKQKDDLERQRDEELFLRKKVEEEFSKKVETHEEEVQLRLKFEQKLNNMHALHRDLQAKYQRALEDIYALETSSATLIKTAAEQKTELVSLRSEKVEHESKILFLGERVKQLLQESDMKFRHANELELKLNKANADAEHKALQVKNLENTISEQKIKLESQQAQVEGLSSEKRHLELSLRESQEQRLQYQAKSDRLQKLNEDLFAEMQEYKQQLVGVTEIKRDRDDRLEKLRAELEEVASRCERSERDHAALRVNFEHVSEQYKSLKEDFEAVSEKLALSNKVRNEKEDLLNEKIKNFHVLSESYAEKEHQTERLKREVDRLSRRLAEAEMQVDQLEIKKRSVEKQSEIQRKQLLDKVSALNEVVSQEKDAREMWIQRFEKEQKSHINTNNELLHQKGSVQDALLKVKNLEIVIDSVTKQRDLIKHNNQELQRQVSELLSAKETAERELFSKAELLRTVEEHHIIYARKLQAEHKEFGQRKAIELQGKQMEYEDLRTYSQGLFEERVQNIKQAQSAVAKMFEEQAQREKMEKQLNLTTQLYDELTLKYADVCDKLAKSNERVTTVEGQMQEKQHKLDDLEAQLIALKEKEVELRSLHDKNFLLQEKVRQLERHMEGDTLTRGEKTFTNRGIQIKPPKQKERDIQTDPLQYPNMAQAYSTTQASTNIHSSQSQKRPRIASAAPGTNANMMAFSGASQMLRMGEQVGGTLSQGDFNFSEQAIPLNKGSASGFSQQDIGGGDRSGIKSAANKYMHVIPGGTEAIEEEAENYGSGQVPQNFQQQYQSYSSGGQYPSIAQQQQLQQMSLDRKPSSGAHNSSSLTQQQQTIQPSALKTHQQASRQVNSFYQQQQQPQIEMHSEAFDMMAEPSLSKKQPSKEQDLLIQDPSSSDVLKAVYEKRINQGTIVQTAATTRPPQPRQQSMPAAMHQNYPMSLQQMAPNQAQPVRILTPAESQMRQEMQAFQKQMTLMNSSSSKQAFGVGKSVERPVTGKASIKTLIKVATARS